MGNPNSNKQPKSKFKLQTIRDDGSNADIEAGFDLVDIDTEGNVSVNIDMPGITDNGTNKHYTEQNQGVKQNAAGGLNSSGTTDGVVSTGANLRRYGGDVNGPGLDGKPYVRKNNS